MKDEKIESVAYFAGRMLKPFVMLWLPFAVSKKIRRDIMDPNKINEPLRLGTKIRKYTKSFMECKVHALPDYFFNRAWTYNEWHKQKYDNKTTVSYNAQPEIDKKQIGDIVAKLGFTPVLTVSYFEKTKHQPLAPASCEFGDYVIQFSSAGTEWCGGMRGNGYISKKMPDGTRKPICTISPNLSDYLAEIAHGQYELMKTKTR